MTFSAAILLLGLSFFLNTSAHVHKSFESGFNPLHHSGPASPYFNAPSQFGIPVGTPAGCVVEQAAYIVRHGSRFPEPGSFSGWQTLFNKLQNASYTASGPLAFLPSWVPPVDDVPHEPLFLSATGSSEAFQLGAELRMRYNLTRGGANFTVWSAGQQRCVDTAAYWLRGYLGQGDYLASPGENRGTVVFMPDSVNDTGADSLTPSAACPAYSGAEGTSTSTGFRATYQDAIARRLNRFLDGLELDATDVGVMQDLCGFSFEINHDRRFCDIFQESEWLDYEYAHDLNYYYGSGPGNPLAATTGYPWLKAVTDLLVAGPQTSTSNGSFVPPPLLMGFTHDNNIPPVIAALGIMNTSAHRGVYPLALDAPDARRTFRASYIVSFLGHVALERLSCGAPLGQSVRHVAGLSRVPGRGPDAKKYILIRVNNAPVPIPACRSGPASSCPLAEFAAYVDGPQAAHAGDFVAKCGLAGVPGAADAVDFFIDPHSAAARTNTFLLGIDPQVGMPST